MYKHSIEGQFLKHTINLATNVTQQSQIPVAKLCRQAHQANQKLTHHIPSKSAVSFVQFLPGKTSMYFSNYMHNNMV